MKSTYECKVRFYHDDLDKESTVYWYFVPETNQRFEGYTKFATGNYPPNGADTWEGVGEVKGTKRFRRNPNVWNFPSTCVRGTPAQFANGMSVKDPIPPVPACCAPRPHYAGQGGIGIGDTLPEDTTDTSYEPEYEVEGGMAVGGTADLRSAVVILATGGLRSGGTAEAYRVTAPGTAGGVSIGGEASPTRGQGYSAAGGVSIGGEASPTRGQGYSAAGGIAIDGTAPRMRYTALGASGGLAARGEAELGLGTLLDASGGLLCGGEASMTVAAAIPTAGGVGIGGEAEVTGPPEGVDACGCTGVPETLYAAFTPTSGCACLASVVVELTHSSGVWSGTASVCSSTLTVTFTCFFGSNWQLTAVCSGGSFPASLMTVAEDCDPFLFGGELIFGSFSNCCTGNVDVTITE